MTVNITTHPEFVRQMKRHAKKYRSLANDYADFLTSIRKDPFTGIDLGGGIHKVRLAVASKGKGKSGGMRFITFSLDKIDDETIHVNPIIYLR